MRAITTPLYLLAAIPILGAIVVLGWINSSPRLPRVRREYVVFGWAL